MHRLFRDHHTEGQDFVTFWKSSAATRHMRRLTDRHKEMTECPIKVMDVHSFTIDSFLFNIHKPHQKTDNSCVMVEYHDEEDPPETKRLCYGHITRIFKHKVHKDVDESLSVFIEAEWYSKTGEDAITGLTRVRRNHNFDASRVNPAKEVLCCSFALWPASPFGPSSDELFVIVHRGVDVSSL